MMIAIFLGGMLSAQDGNVTHDLALIERMLAHDEIEVAIPRDIRFKGDAAKTAIIKRADGFFMRVKLKRSAQGGEAFNNQPRYEIAAYHLQQLFLDAADYVVPPTAGRFFPRAQFEEIEKMVYPTFPQADDVFCTLQYWLSEVTSKNVWDKNRFATDERYAYHAANLNIFTCLIRHSDSNVGNLLISKLPDNPRLFAVDNGLAFGEITSERGYEWRNLLMDRLPARTVARLRGITREMLDDHLGVVAQYELRDGHFVPVAVSDNLNPAKGVRQTETQLQIGLTDGEIDGVYRRLREILEKVDGEKLALF